MRFPSRLTACLAGLAALSALVAAGCGSSSSGTSASSTASGSGTSSSATKVAVQPPSKLASGGKLTICSDMSYPPEISLKNGQPVGYDADFGKALAKSMGLSADFLQASLTAMISGAQTGKCDVAIESMTITPERLKSVYMVPYGHYGYTILVKQGNPKNVTTVNSLCGLAAGAPVGSNYQTLLQQESAKCKKAGKPGIDVVGFQTDAEGVQALLQGKLDSYMEDSPPSNLYLQRTKGQLQAGGDPNQVPTPMGVIVAKNNPAMNQAVIKAVKALYADGALPAIYKKWGLPGLSQPPQ